MKQKKRRRPLTPYERCLKQEKDRVHDWRESAQGRFESSFLNFDTNAFIAGELRGDSVWLSDKGRGARIVRNLGGPTVEKQMTHLQNRIDRARMAVVRHLPDCIDTFWLVLKNGNDKDESIWQLMKKMASKKQKRGRRRKPSILNSSKKC